MTLLITFEVISDQKIRELPIDEALTVLAARQLRMLLPGEEGMTGAEGRGPGSPAGSPTFSGLFIPFHCFQLRSLSVFSGLQFPHLHFGRESESL